MMVRRAAVIGTLALLVAQQPSAAQDFDVAPLRQCNSPKAEYAPTYDVVTSSIIFTSEQSGVAALYRARLDESTGIDRVVGTFNNPRHQRGCVSLDSSGNGVGVVYATYDDQMYAGLTTVTRQGADVNLGRAIATLNGPMYVSQPALSPDGSRLAFVSTRDGGRGGLDLWVCERRDDLTWSEPVNFGRNVNSDADEITPFFASSDTLFFASNGFGGRGGFDVMMSVLRDGVWHEPIPVDGVNSEYDDSDCIVLRNGSMIFASTRPGGQGGLDLWIAQQRTGQ
jgi:Tol biopolymer transport system component